MTAEQLIDRYLEEALKLKSRKQKVGKKQKVRSVLTIEDTRCYSPVRSEIS